MKKIIDNVVSIIGIVIIALLIRAIIFQISLIPSGSMIPNLNVGDKVIVNKLYFGIQNPLFNAGLKKHIMFVFPNPLYRNFLSKNKKNKYLVTFKNKPKRFEVIVFVPPEEPVLGHEYYFEDNKSNEPVYFQSPRLIGENYVKRLIGLPGEKLEIINGEIYINDSKLQEDFIRNIDYFDFGPIKIPQDCYFMMGDNRPRSSDSRVWGVVPASNLLGKALYKFWPLNEAGLVK